MPFHIILFHIIIIMCVRSESFIAIMKMAIACAKIHLFTFVWIGAKTLSGKRQAIFHTPNIFARTYYHSVAYLIL